MVYIDRRVIVSNRFDDHLKHNIEVLCNSNTPLSIHDFVVDATVTTQKIIHQAEEIKRHLTNNQQTIGICKLLLLSAKLEMINGNLIDIKHEYNL